uniref:E2f-associated phospho n=1 Tax=Tetraselmis sp. GSL018 TaxID=582737 RepID=A0A061QNJ6_9CHLO|mmetsp:Transcript_31950/g.75904  ORF Transcript_31950/g.75904 Transcript_31950/m.75904 type:complete len:174 (-) Transcript_31950:1137-1658(-)
MSSGLRCIVDQEVSDKWWLSEGSESDTSSDETPKPLTEEDKDRLLYDPEIDDKDAAWVASQRMQRASDAILNCPGCFTTLCLDCQKHVSYENQWRAMSTMNCKITSRNYEANCSSLEVGPVGRKRKAKGESSCPPTKQQHNVRVVECEVCDTEVGVIDEEGVYHFFNVFPSTA